MSIIYKVSSSILHILFIVKMSLICYNNLMMFRKKLTNIQNDIIKYRESFMVLNLWDRYELLENFMGVYKITGMQMCNIFKRLNMFNSLNIEDNIIIFCEETDIKLDKIDIACNVEFLGKIVSTTIDNFKHLKQKGILPLDVLLEEDSPIRQFLKEYQIELNPSKHELLYEGKKFHIPYGKDCEWCSYGYKRCQFSHRNNNDMFCEYQNAINNLAAKVYYDNGEIEMFLTASKDKMLSYSTVNRYPEIFETIDIFFTEFLGKNLNLGNEWNKIKQHSCIITVQVKYDEMSYRNNFISCENKDNACDNLLMYKRFCNKNYESIEQIPQCFWDNIWIINTCLDVLSSDNNIPEICAGIKHSVCIPFDRLKIELI